MHHMQQNISAPGKDIKTFTFTDSNLESLWCDKESKSQTKGMPKHP